MSTLKGNMRAPNRRGHICASLTPTRGHTVGAKCALFQKLGKATHGRRRQKLLWAMKRHQGELRMFGGIWKKHSSGEIPKGADQQFKLSPEELLALERRTHPLTCERDHIDPIIYSALEIRARVNRGERPAPEQVVGIFWARPSLSARPSVPQCCWCG